MEKDAHLPSRFDYILLFKVKAALKNDAFNENKQNPCIKNSPTRLVRSHVFDVIQWHCMRQERQLTSPLASYIVIYFNYKCWRVRHLCRISANITEPLNSVIKTHPLGMWTLAFVSRITLIPLNPHVLAANHKYSVSSRRGAQGRNGFRSVVKISLKSPRRHSVPYSAETV